MADTQPTTDTNRAAEASSPATTALTPELVREIADKVYALMLADLRIDRERRRMPGTGADAPWRMR